MIVYENTLNNFIDECANKTIANVVANEMHNSGILFSHNEEEAWYNSLPYVAKALDSNDINKDINVAIEYKSVLNNSRIDFLVYGKDNFNNDSIVVVELKQWSKVHYSNKPNYVYAYGGGGQTKDYFHPSYQSLRYTYMLKGFNEYVQDKKVNINSCSYCHNMDNIYEKFINNKEKYKFLEVSPIYLKDDALKLRNFIKKYVKTPSRILLYEIDNAKIRPSKDFAKMLYNAIQGNEIFTLDDGQASSVSTIIYEVDQALKHNKRRTIIIKGGPGTGKSIVAINAMGQLLNPKDGTSRKNVCYCTPNYTPKQLFSELLIQDDYKKSAIKNLFKSLSAFSKVSECEYDCVLFDEAHRAFTWKFGYQVSKGIDMIDKAFYASRVNVWFIDEDQVVTKDDFLTIDKIKEYAKKYNSEIIEGDDLKLSSQFRCTGGDAYISFINGFLGYNGYKLTKYKPKNYEFKVFDTPTAMYEEIQKKQNEFKNSRLLAGYTHEWVSKKDDTLYDFDMDSHKFLMKWNKFEDYSYINDDYQLDRIGCIHTIQGVDMAYAGIIIGKDLIYRDGKLIFNKTENAKSDKASGIRNAKNELAIKLIRNTYKVLLTRAIYGTFVYCEDQELNKYLKTLIVK